MAGSSAFDKSLTAIHLSDLIGWAKGDSQKALLMLLTIPIMLSETAQSLIPSLRFAVLVLWFIPILWALPAYRRVILTGHLTFHDWVKVAFGSVGIFIVGLQIRSFFNPPTMFQDYWTAAMLLLASFAAILTMAVVYWVAQPENCRRAMFRAHLGIFVLCMIGGFL